VLIRYERPRLLARSLRCGQARGLELHQAHSLALWDGLIVQAALDSRCAILLSEDLQHGRRFGSLEVANPFLADAAHEAAARVYGSGKPSKRAGKRTRA
jgi:hypothetical protein